MTTFVWQPELHAAYCPKSLPPPADGGGSSWLCCCTEALNDSAPAEASSSPVSPSGPLSVGSARVSGAEKDTA